MGGGREEAQRAITKALATRQARAVEFHLVGPPRLVMGAAHQALERHDAALIALLVNEGPMPRGRMAVWLWPDAPQAVGRSNLRQRLHRLLQTAGSGWLEDRTTLRIAVDCVDLQTAATRLRADPTALPGELLAGFDYSDIEGLDDWVRMAREQWQRTRIDLLSAQAAEHEAAGRLVAALAFANRIVQEEPLQEIAHRRVMRLHYLRVDRAAALVAARTCVETLERELGVAPDEETRAVIATIEVAVVVQPRAPPPAPMSLRRPPRLIARDEAWQALERAATERAAALVTGEAGIGKTRLLDDFARVRPDALMIAALAGDDRLPYSTIAQLLRAAFRRHGEPAPGWTRDELARIVSSLGEPPVAAADPLRIAAAIEAEVERWHAGGLGLLIVDDLHYADAATLQLLPSLIGRTTAAPKIAWMLAARTSELPPGIDAWAARAAPRALQRIALAPLQLDEVIDLLESITIAGLDSAAAAPALLRHTGGNPFFLVETLLALNDDPPADRQSGAGTPLPVAASTRQLLRQRLARLAPLPLRLARVIALAGQDFDEALATSVLECRPGDLEPAWHALEREGVLVGARLAHDLLREEVLAEIPAPTARTLHRLVAEALDVDGNAPPARIADHWAAAGRLDRAAPRWIEAAHNADRASRFMEATGLFEIAADAFARAGQAAEQHKALQETVSYSVRRQDLAAAERIATRLSALATDNDSHAWALDRQCEIALIGREDARAEALALQAQELGTRSSDGWIAFNVSKKLAIALAFRGCHNEALAIMAAHRVWADEHADDRNALVWFSDRATLLDIADQHDEASRAFDEAIARSRQAQNWYGVYAATRNRGLQRHARGDLAGALCDSNESLLQTEHLDPAYTTRNPRDAIRRAAIWRDAGRHREALEWLEQSRSTLAAGDNRYWADLCDDQLALSYLELGQPSRALSLCKPDPTSGHVEARASRALVRARLARRRGRPIDVPVAFDAHCPRRLALLLRLEASQSLSADAALAALLGAEREADDHGLHGIALHARALAARAAHRVGRHPEADALLRAALEQSTTLHPTGLTRAEFQWLSVELLRHLGDKAGACALTAVAVRELGDRADLPEALRVDFFNLNPVHRELALAAERRR